MKVNYLNLTEQFNDEILWVVVKKQFEECHFIMGPELERFESGFASLCDTPFALGVNSGTDAIFLALKSLNIGLGDEVITPPNSFIATTGAIVATGARPVFVDVAEDYNIDATLIEAAISPVTKAILPVHLTGNPADMKNIMQIARENNLYVIEDAAQAAGASINGQKVGSFGDIGCFSLHPLKNLNVCGDGGVLTVKSEALYNKLSLLRNHGLRNRDEIDFFGYNSRLDTIQAAVANHGLKDLNAITEARRKNAGIYDNLLKDMGNYVTTPQRRKKATPVFHTYIVRVQDRENLIRYLDDNDVETKIHYPVPNHLQKPCREMGYQFGNFPVCEAQARTILSLPIHQHLNEQQIYYVSGLIKAFYGV